MGLMEKLKNIKNKLIEASQLMTVAYGGSLKQAGLDGHVIQPDRLQKIAERKK